MRQADLKCEVCSASDWRTIGRRTYRKADCGAETDYKYKRFRVLFELWFLDRSEVELSCVVCNQCGFVIYVPRPEQSDLDAKYVFLGESYEGFRVRSRPADSPNERRRSAVAFGYVSKGIDLGGVREVLDYGGDDGRLMQAFLKQGMACHNVDYNKNCIPGVKWLGESLADLEQERQFDLIVCSHVLEHVAEPLRLVSRLAEHMKPGGWLYVEVPMEIWGRPPLHEEPVTHVNFFTPNSLWNLLRLSGLDVHEARLTRFLSSAGKWHHAVRSLAQRNAEAGPMDRRTLRQIDVDQYLSPGFLKSLQYYAICPPALLRTIRRRFM